MSDTMFYGVLRMPYEMAMEGDISRLQFYDRVQECANRCESAEAEVARLTQALADKDLQVMEAQELSQRAVRDVSDLYERQRQDGNEIAQLGEQLQAANRQAEEMGAAMHIMAHALRAGEWADLLSTDPFVTDLEAAIRERIAAPQQHAQSLPMTPTDDMCRAAREKIGIGSNIAGHAWRIMASEFSGSFAPVAADVAQPIGYISRSAKQKLLAGDVGVTATIMSEPLRGDCFDVAIYTAQRAASQDSERDAALKFPTAQVAGVLKVGVESIQVIFDSTHLRDEAFKSIDLKAIEDAAYKRI